MVTWVLRTLSLGFVCGLVAACGSDGPLSDEDAKKQFADVVAGANSCTAATDCVLIMPECPLGCYAAVNANQASAVQSRAADIVKQNRSGGRTCVYDCAAPPQLTCESGRCAMKFDANP